MADIAAQGLVKFLAGTWLVTAFVSFWDWLQGQPATVVLFFAVASVFLSMAMFWLLAQLKIAVTRKKPRPSDAVHREQLDDSLQNAFSLNALT